MIDLASSAKLAQTTDRIETLTFQPRITESSFSGPFTLYSVQRSRIEKRVNAGGQMMLKRRIVFRVFATDLANAGAPVPKIKDKFTDASGINYIIMEDVDVTMLAQVYTCACQESTAA